MPGHRCAASTLPQFAFSFEEELRLRRLQVLRVLKGIKFMKSKNVLKTNYN